MLFFVIMACLSQEEQACIDACVDEEDFWEACYETLQAEGLYVDCYSETEELGESLAAAGSDSEARWDVYTLWKEQGYVSNCASASDVVDDCVNRITAEFPHLSDEAARERAEECREEDTSPIGTAFKNLDCQGFLTALGF